jgi:hypothetical protein
MTKGTTSKLSSKQTIVSILLTLFIFGLGTGLSAASKDVTQKAIYQNYGQFQSDKPFRQETSIGEDGHINVRLSPVALSADEETEVEGDFQWCWKSTCVHVKVTCPGATDIDGCSVKCPGMGTFECESRAD